MTAESLLLETVEGSESDSEPSLSDHLPRRIVGQLVDGSVSVKIPSRPMKKAVIGKTVSKTAFRQAPKPQPPQPTQPTQPPLNVVPIDDVTRLLMDGFKANLDEVRELCEAAKHPMVTVHKPKSANTTFPPGTTVFSAANDIKPILLNDSDRVTLEALFGGEPLSSPSDVLRLSLRLSIVRLLGPSGEACSTTIPLDTLERLEARRPVDTTLKEMIERGFADYLEGLINGVF